MTEGTIRARHPPAMKVGGRRLSLSMPRHKAPISAEAAVTNTTPETEDKKEPTVPDYPRPVPLTAAEKAAQQQVHRNEEELPPKKEKKYNHHNDKREYAHRKNEPTQPTREMSGGNKDQKMGIRIGQPASKALGV